MTYDAADNSRKCYDLAIGEMRKEAEGWPFGHLERGAYSVISADPPWTYSTFSDKGKERSAEAHYDCMSMDDICALPVTDLAARDAHLFLWITGPCLVRGDHVKVLDAWGFKPSAMAFVWVKPKVGLHRDGDLFFQISEDLFVKGMGHTTRQNAEFVVLGRRGKPKRQTKAMHQIITAPRREHSRKPNEYFKRVEEYAGDVRRAELFARQSRPGWETWGNQSRLFDDACS